MSLESEASPSRVYTIASRVSQLALWQTEHIIAQLQQHHPSARFEILRLETKGDRILDQPLAQLGDKGLFTRELEDALLSGRADFAVHSLKDLPTTLPAGLCIGAVTARADPSDALVLPERADQADQADQSDQAGQAGQADQSDPSRLGELPPGTIVGTSSLRRAAQIRRLHPHLRVESLRGNVNTRLRKVDQGECGCAILAAAGLDRLGLTRRVAVRLRPPLMLHAVGQGILAVECCALPADHSDPRSALIRQVHALLASIHDPRAHANATAERAFLHTLQGGCQVPVGVASTWLSDPLPDHLDPAELMRLEGAVWSLDGSLEYRAHLVMSAANAHQLGVQLAHQLLDQGAGLVLAQIRANPPHVAS